MLFQRMHDGQFGGSGIAEQMRDPLVLQQGKERGAASDAVHSVTAPGDCADGKTAWRIMPTFTTAATVPLRMEGGRANLALAANDLPRCFPCDSKAVRDLCGSAGHPVADAFAGVVPRYKSKACRIRTLHHHLFL